MSVELTSAISEPETASSATPGVALSLQDEANEAPSPAWKPIPEGSPLAGLPLQLDVTVPIRSFRVQDLLALKKDSVLEADWSHADDIPVWCGGVQLAWTEFEVVDRKLAVRVTRIG